MPDTDRTCAICDTPFPEDAGYCPSCGAATPTQIEEEPMDFAGRYRNLPFLGVPRPEVLAAAIRAE